MITLGGWTGRNVLGNGRFGYVPSEFAALGIDPSPLADDADLPTDVATEFVWVIKGSLPSSGALVCNDDGGMSHTGAADGSYTTLYDLYTWAPGGGVTSEGEGSFTTNFGAATTTISAAVAAAEASGLAAAVSLRTVIVAGPASVTTAGLRADIAAISTAPVQPEIAVGPGGASTKRRLSREQIERQEQEDEAFEVMMKHLKQPSGNHDAELQEVLEVVMALAAAGVLD